MIHLLAIDDATHSGYALLRADGPAEPSIVASGALKLSTRVSHSRQIYGLLRGLPAAPDHVAIESPVPYYTEDGKLRNWKGLLTQCGIMALWADAVFEVYDKRPEIVSPSKWQNAIFRGMMMGSTKAKSCRFCKAKWNYDPSDDNEADALCLAFYLWTLYFYEPEIDDEDPGSGIVRAMMEHVRRKGGDPMLLEDMRRK